MMKASKSRVVPGCVTNKHCRAEQYFLQSVAQQKVQIKAFFDASPVEIYYLVCTLEGRTLCFVALLPFDFWH